jgi:hypothetical protein
MSLVSNAAFADDPLQVRLFPPSLDTSDIQAGLIVFRESRILRRMTHPAAWSSVVVDDASENKIVGFAQWEGPMSPEVEAQGAEAFDAAMRAEEQGYPLCMDREVLRQYQDMLKKERKRLFGESNCRDLWCKSYIRNLLCRANSYRQIYLFSPWTPSISGEV